MARLEEFNASQEEVLFGIAGRVLVVVVEFNPQNLADMARAFATQDARQAELVGMFAGTKLVRLAEFSTQDLAGVARISATPGIRDEDPMEVIARRKLLRREALTPQDGVSTVRLLEAREAGKPGSAGGAVQLSLHRLRGCRRRPQGRRPLWRSVGLCFADRPRRHGCTRGSLPEATSSEREKTRGEVCLSGSGACGAPPGPLPLQSAGSSSPERAVAFGVCRRLPLRRVGSLGRC